MVEDCAVNEDGCLDWVLGEDCAAAGESCNDNGEMASCVEATGCVEQGGSCWNYGDFAPRCQSGEEPLDPQDLVLDCTPGTACCVDSAGTECGDAGYGCYRVPDLGCSAYGLVAVELACDADLTCCVLPM